MAIRLWPQDYERKDHITKAEKGILRYAARNFQNGHMVVGIDPVGLSGERVKLGMYISPSEGLVTFSIYSGMINAMPVFSYIAYVQMVEGKIYERLLDSKLLIVRNGEKKALKFPYKHIVMFPDEVVGKTTVSKDDLQQLRNYATFDSFRPITSDGKEKRIEDLKIFAGIRKAYDKTFKSLSELECRAIFERLAPEYTVVLNETINVCVAEKKTLVTEADLRITGKELEYKTFFLDEYQVGVVNDMGKGHRVILANPGAGKSVLLLSKVFNAGIDVVGDDSVEFQNIKLDYFKNSYRKRPMVHVVAENTSAAYHEEDNSIRTDNIPRYYQMRLKTKDALTQYVTFEKLIQDPVGNLTVIYEEMKSDYEKCVYEFNHTRFQTVNAKERFKDALENYQHEIGRFRKGIDQIEYRDFVKKAFVYMNKTFMTKLAGEHRQISGWRLFQIVFIVSLICEMIRSEYKNDPNIAEADIATANLLYFPTGGGKTEAFLGACVFNMFFDRLRGKNDGITAFLKYPLRLLAVQQLDRVLMIVMKANVVRESSGELAHKTPFQVGFFVGKGNTPNKIDSFERLSERGDKNKTKDLILESDSETLNEYYRFIDTCPYCGKKHVNLRFNRDTWRLEHVCDNPECPIMVLPLMIVDNEIYRYLPSIVVSTIDKMAMLGTSNDFKMLFGQVKKKCPVHGFTGNAKCSCASCGGHVLQNVGLLKDPIPTLFIQDEMHLVKESLGTFDAHYESFLSYYAKELVPEAQRKLIRFVGATATISMYESHIWHLYHMDGRRFPCEYPSAEAGEDFYSYTDNNDIAS